MRMDARQTKLEKEKTLTQVWTHRRQATTTPETLPPLPPTSAALGTPPGLHRIRDAAGLHRHWILCRYGRRRLPSRLGRRSPLRRLGEGMEPPSDLKPPCLGKTVVAASGEGAAVTHPRAVEEGAADASPDRAPTPPHPERQSTDREGGRQGSGRRRREREGGGGRGAAYWISSSGRPGRRLLDLAGGESRRHPGRGGGSRRHGGRERREKRRRQAEGEGRVARGGRPG
jgi:hypothetical protein